MTKFTLNLELNKEQTNEFLAANSDVSKRIYPELTTPDKINKPQAYKRFLNQEEKTDFRQSLLNALEQAWQSQYGIDPAKQLMLVFLNLIEQVAENGAVIFGDMIQKANFKALVKAYDDLLNQFGNKSWIHSYVNLGNHPDFLSNETFSDTFLHPLIVAIIAYQIGGPIRLVDARAKDAEPISVKAQDNMLHIDNTPFNDEYKVIVTWEKGKASGPKGQNFVIIPGTHKGARNCFLKEDMAWSTENGSIFVTPETIDNVFNIQKDMLQIDDPLVIEIHDDNKPVTAVFAAGSLVHHRYRTESGSARSCSILAFHRASDNPGQFMAPEYISDIAKSGDLNSFLFGFHGKHTESDFIKALMENAERMAKKILEFNDVSHSTEIIVQSSRQLTKEELKKWRYAVTDAPTVEALKIKDINFPLGKSLNEEEFKSFLVNSMMMYDKHGPLDLILYDDAHEEIRKWARNRIREMNIDHLQNRLSPWFGALESPTVAMLLKPNDLNNFAALIKASIDSIPKGIKHLGNLGKKETISSFDAYRSLAQLIDDLGEAILRCDSRQNFLSTSLFLFWAVDELLLLIGESNDSEVDSLVNIGQQLLSNYISTAVLIEKQIQQEIKVINENSEKEFVNPPAKVSSIGMYGIPPTNRNFIFSNEYNGFNLAPTLEPTTNTLQPTSFNKAMS